MGIKRLPPLSAHILLEALALYLFRHPYAAAALSWSSEPQRRYEMHPVIWGSFTSQDTILLQPRVRRNKSLLSCSRMKTCWASSQRAASPSNTHQQWVAWLCNSRFAAAAFTSARLCLAEKSSSLIILEQPLRVFTHAQTTGRTSSARLWELQPCKYLIGSSCLLGCGLQNVNQSSHKH